MGSTNITKVLIIISVFLLFSTSIVSAQTVVDFDNPSPGVGQDSDLNGVFQGINFGSSQWAFTGPFGPDTTNSVYFNSNVNSRTFTFTTPSVLNSVNVYTAGNAGTLTLSDDNGQSVSQAITTGSMQLVTTGWTQQSTTVTVDFTEGWALGVDDITYGGSITDTFPPTRSNGQPTGSLAAGTTQTTISLDTNEDSTCRYSTNAGVDYNSMTNTFSTTGGTSHLTTVSSLSDGQSYSYYVRCIDSESNANPDDFTISFSIGVPGDGFSLRFFGGGVNAPDADRAKILIDDVSNSLPGPAVDVGATDFTLEFWMRANAADNTAGSIACGNNLNWINGNIVLDRDRFNFNRKYGVSIGGGNIVFGTTGEFEGAGTGTTICSTTNVLDNQWHHVAVQRRRSDGYIWLYIDGVLEAEADGGDGDISYPDNGVPGNFCNGPCDFSDPYLVIGAEKHDAGSAFPSYAGLFDEFRISTSLRYTGSFTPQTTPFDTDANTVGLYHFDEGSGTVAADVSGVGPDNAELRLGGTPQGPLWETDSPISGNSTPGDTVPPVVSSGTNTIVFSVNTDESSTCRYDTTAGTPYASMPNTFDTTGGVAHSTTVAALASGTFNYYIKCQDGFGNANSGDIIVTFTIS